MTDLVLGIRITADGQAVVTSARQARDEIGKLGQAARDSNRTAKTEADNYVTSLRRQADTIGMTRSQTIAYEASQHKLTEAQRQAVQQSRRQIEAHERNQQILGHLRVAALAYGAAVAATATLVVQKTMEAEQAQARLEAVVRATGQAAGFTARELSVMADEVERSTLFDADDVRNAISILLTFRKVAGDTFRETIQVATSMAALMRTDLSMAMRQLGLALEDPATGLTMLRRSGVSFNDEQREMITRMIETGRQGKAMTEILKIMREQGIDRIAESLRTGMTGAARGAAIAWDEFLEAIGKTPQAQGAVTSTFSTMETRLKELKTLVEMPWTDRLLTILSGGLYTPPVQSADERAGVVPGRSGIIRGSTITPQQFGGQSEVERRVDDLKALLKFYQDRGERPKTDQTDFVGLVFSDFADQDAPRLMAQYKRAAEEVNRSLVAGAEEQIRIQERQDEVISGLTVSFSEYRQELEFEAEIIGLSETQREKAIALRKLENDFIKQTAGLTAEQIDLANQLFDAERQRISEALDRRGAAKEAAEQLKAAQEEAKRFQDDLARGLTDSIFRGFEAGKSFGQNFWDSMKNMAATTILRPVVQFLVSPITGAVGAALGGLGIPGLAGASGGGVMDLLSLGSSASSLAGGPSVGSTLAGLFGGGAAAGAFGLGTAAAGAGTAAGFGTAFGLAGTTASSVGLSAAGTGLGLSATGTGLGLSAGSGALATGGSAAAAGAAGGLGAAAAAAIPVVGLGIAALGLMGAFGGKKLPPLEFRHADLAGIASASGFQTTGAIARSNRESWAFTPPQFQSVNAAVRDAFSVIKDLGRTLGVDVSRLSGAQVGLGFQATPLGGPVTGPNAGPTEQGALAGFQQVIGQLTDQLARTLIPNLSEFAKGSETATQTLTRLVQARLQEEGLTSQLAGQVRALPGQLGLTGLEAARNALATGANVAPLERFASARRILEETYSRAIGGDLASVQAFPNVLQQALTVGRDVFASGAQFQELFVEGNRQLNELLSRQQQVQTDIMADLPITIQQASQDQIIEIRRLIKTTGDGLKELKDELRRIREAA